MAPKKTKKNKGANQASITGSIPGRNDSMDARRYAAADQLTFETVSFANTHGVHPCNDDLEAELQMLQDTVTPPE